MLVVSPFEPCIFHSFSCRTQSTIDSAVELSVEDAAEDAAEDSAEQGVEEAVEQAQNGTWKAMFWEKIFPGSASGTNGQGCWRRGKKGGAATQGRRRPGGC